MVKHANQHYEKMFVTVPESAMDDPNHLDAIDDMNAYIERMGGSTHTPLTCGEIVYAWTVPAHWTFRFYQRFDSFGLRARVRPDSIWFDLLGEKS
jgi:hypothetical protein